MIRNDTYCAVLFHRAFRTFRCFRWANCSSEFHHSLIKVTRSCRGHNTVGVTPKSTLCIVGMIKVIGFEVCPQNQRENKELRKLQLQLGNFWLFFWDLRQQNYQFILFAHKVSKIFIYMIRNTLKPLNHYHLIVWLLAISAPIFLILEITRITFPSTKPTGCRKAIEAIAEAVYFPTPKGTVIPILQLFIHHLSYIFVTKTLYQLILSDYFPLDVFFRQLSCYHMIELV